VDLGAGWRFLQAGTEGGAGHGAKRSGLGSLEWRLPKIVGNSADLCGDESTGLHGLRRGFGPIFVDDLRGEIAEGLVGPLAGC
jgi:hypothetical protein